MNPHLALLVCASSCAIATVAAQAQMSNTGPPGPGSGGPGGGGLAGFGGGRRGAPPPAWIEPGYDDHSNMMYQLGIKTLRPGKSGSNQTGPGFDEATANEWMGTMPDVLKMKDGTKVTTAAQWPKRRAEILEDFEREVYGRIPANAPKVTWEITSTNETEVSGVPVITKVLVGHVDNSLFTNITVNIRASFTIPANTPGPVPVLISFGGVGGGFGGFGGRGAARGGGTNVSTNGIASPARGGRGAFGAAGGGISGQALAKGWGYGSLDPASIQADAGGNALRQGIIGLVNKGQPRKPDDWGALRAWGWGFSRLIDYFEANLDSKVNAKFVGVEGVSRYGKAAIVTEAFDERVGPALVASSGEGGAKLHRHDFGEAVENLTGGEYYWMAGNFIKYGASDINGKSMNASDLPVDSHELIALCAPRPCFISVGVESAGDPKWIDAAGLYRAGLLASPVYALLGGKGYGEEIQDWVRAPLPPVGTLVGHDLVFRQHEGGHTSGPNIPIYFDWVGSFIKSPALPPSAPPKP